MENLTRGEVFVLGMVTTLVIVTLLYVVIPAVWWALHDRLVERAQRPGVDELLDLDTCDLCLRELTDDVAAITCDAHRYCGDCDDASNRCTACAYARRLVLSEEGS